jgi:dipeptidase E
MAGTRLLLISNSIQHGRGYLDHVEEELREFLGPRRRVLFFPYAQHDWKSAADLVCERMRRMNYSVQSIHDISNQARAVQQAEALFVGGGNTFRLLSGLYAADVLKAIRSTVEQGTPYLGSSAGSIIACPTLKTTKDMPVVQPPSFEALGLVRFQISPHYLDPDPNSKHMGETQEERIGHYHQENDLAVVGLREGSFLRVEQGQILLKGEYPARVFRRGEIPREAQAGTDLAAMLT